MNFEVRHAIYPKNEVLRANSGRFTLLHLIDNVAIKALKPSPLPCSCGHYPSIDIDDSKGKCFVYCNGCTVKLEFQGSYSGAILEWNKLKSVVFDIDTNTLIPFVAFNGDIEDFIFQVTKVKNDALGLKKVTVRTEKKLISLIVHWCNFGIEKSKQLV